MQVVSREGYLQGITPQPWRSRSTFPALFHRYNLHCTGLKITLIWLLSFINNVKTICNRYIIFPKNYKKSYIKLKSSFMNEDTALSALSLQVQPVPQRWI